MGSLRGPTGPGGFADPRSGEQRLEQAGIETRSGVLEGGTIATNGPPPPMTLPPSSAAIVFP